eukprot:m.5096 g.5096  ORF g.5096 m.5096 type:complete len:335 (+) comp4127_c0_seq1:66-1070(+)
MDVHTQEEKRKCICLTRNVSSSFMNALNGFAQHAEDGKEAEEINVEKAIQEHEEYTNQLSKNENVKEVVRLSAQDKYPDCMFIEDTAVIARGVCVIVRPGAPTRQGEEEEVRRFVSDNLMSPNLNPAVVHELHTMSEHDEGATCEGGDVMVTNTHMFVGISSRTNMKGFLFLKKVFEKTGIKVCDVQFGDGCLHLKSVITWGGDDLGFFASNTTEGHKAWEIIQDHLSNDICGDAQKDTAAQKDAQGGDVTFTREWFHANVLRIGNKLYHTETEEKEAKIVNKDKKEVTDDAVSGNPIKEKCLENGVEAIFINNNEAKKADGALTCCSIVIHTT